MNSIKTSVVFGLLATAGFLGSCSDDDGSNQENPPGAEVCQAAINHAAECAGREAATFLGKCEGATAASATETTGKTCAQINSGKADGYCDEFMASMGMCESGDATLGPWGFRSTEIALSSAHCRRTEDLIEPGLELVKATTAETCMETNEFRPIINIGDEDTFRKTGVPYPDDERDAMLAPYGLVGDDAFLVLGNFGHTDAAMTLARIPIAAFATSQAYYLIESFEISGLKGSHGMIRIRFDSPVVELYTQYPPSKEPIANTQELILSVHAVAVRDGSYDPIGAGLHDGMALARGIYSIENKVKDVVINRSHIVDQYKLTMTGDDIKRYVLTYTNDSPERVFSTSYHTLARNCGTEILQVFADTFVERNYALPANLADNAFEELLELLEDQENGRFLPDILPSEVRPALESRGLFGEEADPWSVDPTVLEVVQRLQSGD